MVKIVAHAEAPAANPGITDRLRRDLLNGRRSPGERLVELQLATEFDVGRAAVRSALLELHKEGLVERETNRGATVRRVSIREAIQLTEARAALESLVAAYAARNATARDRSGLMTIVQNMRIAVDTERWIEYSQLNTEFHRTLQRVSGHVIAQDLIENLRNRVASLNLRLALIPGRPKQSLDQHRVVAEAVVARDEDGAAAAMADHLSSVIEALEYWAKLDPELNEGSVVASRRAAVDRQGAGLLRGARGSETLAVSKPSGRP
jgi:DNA-binding GntR family transcriptional regulator